MTPDLLPGAARGDREFARGRAERLAVVRVASSIDASPGRVFDAWLDPRIAGKWLFATAARPMTRVAIDARVRGRFRFVDRHEGVEHAGVYVEIDRPRRLVFSLSARDSLPVTRVIAEIAPRGLSTDLTVLHGNVPREHAVRIEARWTGMLYGLALLLDRT